MKAIKTILCLGAMCMLATASAKADNVYICTGKSATKYHKVQNCRGLNSCSADVKAVSETTAKNNGREKCLICYATNAGAVKKATTTAVKVYVTPSGAKYHKDKACTLIAKSKNVQEMTLTAAKEKYEPCSKCAATTAKAATEKKATEKTAEKKTAEKKATAEPAEAKTAAKATGTSKVYVAAGGTKYHKIKSCTALAKSKNVKSLTLAEAKTSMTPCSVCYASAKKAASKPAAEKKTTEKKATTEKKTTEKKAAAPAASAESTTASKATGTSKVYVAAGGSKYHKKKSCTALAKSKDIKSITLADAKKSMTPCSVCYTSAKKAATKATTTKKAADEKATTTKKTTTRKAA